MGPPRQPDQMQTLAVRAPASHYTRSAQHWSRAEERATEREVSYFDEQFDRISE